VSESIQTVLNEFKTLCPDVASAAAFKANGETLASTDTATPQQTQTILECLNSLTNAQCIGGVKHLTIQGITVQLSITAVGDVYLATLSRRTANDKAVKSLTRIVAPTVISLALGVTPSAHTATAEVEEPKTDAPNIPEALAEFVIKAKAFQKQFQPAATPNQLMVEKQTGFMVANDTVRVDGEILQNWQDTLNKPLSCVVVETLEGKTVTCKVKPIKDGKANSRGLVFVPEKLIQALGTEQGKLVMVKPAPEETSSP